MYEIETKFSFLEASLYLVNPPSRGWKKRGGLRGKKKARRREMDARINSALYTVSVIKLILARQLYARQRAKYTRHLYQSTCQMIRKSISNYKNR